MRWSYFIVIQLLIIVLLAGTVYVHKDKVILVKKPPPSLGQWYKPENKRQVWLHNMFKLRREMQAVRFYAERKEGEHLGRWVSELGRHYLEIGEMVPEWKGRLDPASLAILQESAGEGRYEELLRAADLLSGSCEGCHRDYRAVVAAMYRAPDFGPLEIDPSTSFRDHMKKLNHDVNQIKVASGDGMKELALSSLSDLKEGINSLGKSCGSCHKKDGLAYPGDKMVEAMDGLEESLKSGTPKEQGMHLGTLAVLACARCHGVHRITYDAGKLFSKGQDWLELLRH